MVGVYHDGFLSMKHAYENCYTPLDVILVHCSVTPQQCVDGTDLYTSADSWVKRDKVE